MVGGGGGYYVHRTKAIPYVRVLNLLLLKKISTLCSGTQRDQLRPDYVSEYKAKYEMILGW